MIVTVTLNAALDKSLVVPSLTLGHRHRCTPGRVAPGGKGVNVARALKSIGEPVIATGLAGGRTGAQIIEWLTAEGVLNDFARIRDESRVSTLLVDPTSGAATEIVEYGPHVEPSELVMLAEKLAYLERAASVIVFAGSLPRDVSEDFYAGAIRDARKAKLFTVLDSDAQPLRLGLAGEPDLVSPNQREAEELVGFEFHEDEDWVSGLDAIAERGARNVVVTHEGGCHGRFREGNRVVRLSAEAPHLEVVNAVGSGDALLAGLLAAKVADRPLDDAVRVAVATGAASVLSGIAGLVDTGALPDLMAQTTVRELVPAG